MKVVRILALAALASFTLIALSGPIAPAAAQGSGVDTPSGYSLRPVPGGTETGAATGLDSGQRLLLLLAQTRMAFGYGSYFCLASPRQASLSSSRTGGSWTGRLPAIGPADRHRAVSSGR